MMNDFTSWRLGFHVGYKEGEFLWIHWGNVIVTAGDYYTTTNSCTYAAIRRLQLISVISTEAPRESNRNSSVWKPESNSLCRAIVLDSTSQRSSAYSPRDAPSDIKSSLRTDNDHPVENTTCCCRHTHITWYIQILLGRCPALWAWL